MGTPWGEPYTARLRAIAASDRPLIPHECAERARQAAALIDPGRLDRSGPGEAVLLWRNDHSEAWLNLWWRPHDTGYHDHTGSCVGVHVIEGRAWNEPLTIGKPPQARGYGPGETFWFPGEGIHRMDHQTGAVTIHVYSPPIRAIGHYDLHDGQLRRTQGLPDQPSPPSAALYEALHHPADTDPASHGLAANLSRPGRARNHTHCLTVRDRPNGARSPAGRRSFDSLRDDLLKHAEVAIGRSPAPPALVPGRLGGDGYASRRSQSRVPARGRRLYRQGCHSWLPGMARLDAHGRRRGSGQGCPDLLTLSIGQAVTLDVAWACGC